MTKITVNKTWNGEDVKIRGKKVVGQTIFGVGLVIEGQAKLLSAVDYGYLSASITTQSQDNGTELDTPVPDASKKHTYPHEVASFAKIEKPDRNMVVHVGTPVDYGPAIEFGTVKSDAQPFLRPALDLAKGKTLTIAQENGKRYFANYLRRPV